MQHPFRGRKMLTFNDSRQGTARSAMRMQLFLNSRAYAGFFTISVCVTAGVATVTNAPHWKRR